MKKLCFLFLTLLALLAVSSCATTRYVSGGEVYGTEYVAYDDYYTVMAYDGNLLLNRYSPARIVSLNGYVGGYTSVVLDVGGLIVTVSGPTILVCPVGYPNDIYWLRGRYYYRWHENLGVFTRIRPPRGHMGPPPHSHGPGPGHHEPRPEGRPPQHGQPNAGPGHNQPGHSHPAPRSGEMNPNRRPNNNQPNARPQSNQPSARPNTQSSQPRSSQPNVRRSTPQSSPSTRPTPQASPRSSAGSGASRGGSSSAARSGSSSSRSGSSGSRSGGRR